MPRERLRAAGVVVVQRGPPRRYLLLRSARTRRPTWEFPKGAVEPGESEREAAERELREETGLAPPQCRFWADFRARERYCFRYRRPDGWIEVDKEVVYFLAEDLGGAVVLSPESTAYCWATADEAYRLLRFTEKRRVLRAAEVFLDRLDRATMAARATPV